MGLKLKYYMNVLGISDIENMNEDIINKCYRKEAPRRHPDKNGGNNENFIELTEARDSLLDFVYAKELKRQVGNDNDIENTGEYNKRDFLSWLGTVMKKKDPREINTAFRKMVGDVAVKIVDAVGDNNIINIYEVFVKYKDFLCIDDETLENIKKKIHQTNKVMIINPTIDDLINDNVYRLTIDDELYNIPMWHNELYYDIKEGEMVVKCIPILDDTIWITYNNVIHKCIDVTIKPFIDTFNWNGVVSLSIGSKIFLIPYSELRMVKLQTIIFKGQGISKINTKNIYDVSDKSDIIVHVNLNFQN